MANIKEQVKDYLDKGIAASKKAIEKTGTKVQELGEQGVLRYELKKLISKKNKLSRDLGEAVFILFTKDKKETVDLTDKKLSALVKEITSLEKNIKKHKKIIDEKSSKKV